MFGSVLGGSKTKIDLNYITYLLIPWSRVLLEKLTSFQLVKKFPTFMEPEVSLSHLQVPATCPYPEPARSSPYPHPISRRSILILSSHLRQGLPSGLFLSGFLPPKPGGCEIFRTCPDRSWVPPSFLYNGY